MSFSALYRPDWTISPSLVMSGISCVASKRCRKCGPTNANPLGVGSERSAKHREPLADESDVGHPLAKVIP